MTDETQNQAPLKEIFGELFSLLETLETQNAAILQFLKEEGIATDEKLAPYLDRAGNAASVKWRAHRARMQHLFSPIPVAVQEIKKENESRGEKREDKSQGESKRPATQGDTSEPEKDRDSAGTQGVGTSNPITGRVPSPQSAPSGAENKTSQESKTADATGNAAPANQPAPAKSPTSPDSKPALPNASQPDDSTPQSDSDKAASAGKPR